MLNFPKIKISKSYLPYLAVVDVLILVSLVIFVVGLAPRDFPTPTSNITIPKNSSLRTIAEKLEEKEIIRSTSLFKIFVVAFGGPSGVKAGDYVFNERQGVWTVAYRLVKGHQGQPKVVVTVPEGTNVADLTRLLAKKFSNFDTERFSSIAKEYEGYLFPDTYYFLANVTPEEIVKTMRNRFEEKIATIKPQIRAFGRPLKEVINLASLVEKEAYADESRRIIAGILWKRLEKNMPLQVDAPFYYLTGKAGNFTQEDLKIDSPYNTYLYKGLPKGPITNPGLATILDVVTPLKTPYWFYLTDKKGEMRYAETYDRHLANIDRYLK